MKGKSKGVKCFVDIRFCPLIKRKCLMNKCMAWISPPVDMGEGCTAFIPHCKIFQDLKELKYYIANME